MNAIAIIVFLAALVATNAGIVVPSETILQGPSSRTTVVGPDGSVISSLAPGGQIVAGEGSGAIARAGGAPVVSIQAAPVVAAPVAAVVAVGKSVEVPALPANVEGQYVHDYTETLYDDGSYKTHLY